jgi:hypothetical protein
MNVTKTCSKCKINKPLDSYHIRKANKDGHKGICKECTNLKQRIQWRNPIDPKKKHQLAKRYNCTPEEYLARMSSSDVCGICGSNSYLVYDHCHTTNKFRGVLCQGCNKAIGQLGDTAGSVLKAYEYLKRFEDGRN